MSTMHLINQQVFTKHLLQKRHCARPSVSTAKRQNKSLPVLASYCCITNISQSLWVKSPGTAWLGPLLQDPSWGCPQGVSQGYGLISRANWGRTCFQTHLLLSRILFVKGWRMKAFLLAIGPRLSSVPCHLDLPIGQPTTWPLASPKPAGERMSQRDGHSDLIYVP